MQGWKNLEVVALLRIICGCAWAVVLVATLSMKLEAECSCSVPVLSGLHKGRRYDPTKCGNNHSRHNPCRNTSCVVDNCKELKPLDCNEMIYPFGPTWVFIMSLDSVCWSIAPCIAAKLANQSRCLHAFVFFSLVFSGIVNSLGFMMSVRVAADTYEHCYVDWSVDYCQIAKLTPYLESEERKRSCKVAELSIVTMILCFAMVMVNSCYACVALNIWRDLSLAKLKLLLPSERSIDRLTSFSRASSGSESNQTDSNIDDKDPCTLPHMLGYRARAQDHAVCKVTSPPHWVEDGEHTSQE